MRAEYLKGWLRKSTRKKDLLREQWGLLLRLVQRTFGDVNSPSELAWATMVLILKGKGDYQGVGHVEVAWKLCAAVVNCWLKRGAFLCGALHGFRCGLGTGTAKLEANLSQQLAGLTHESLFQVFLGIRKA